MVVDNWRCGPEEMSREKYRRRHEEGDLVGVRSWDPQRNGCQRVEARVRVAVLGSFGRWVDSAEKEPVRCGEDNEKWEKRWPGLKWDVTEVE